MDNDAGTIKMIAAVYLKAGHIIFRDDHTPIGVAARDIEMGETISYSPLCDTADVWVRFGITENTDNADTPKL